MRPHRRRRLVYVGLACVLVAAGVWAALEWRRVTAEQQFLGAWSLVGAGGTPGVSAVLCEFRPDRTCRTAVAIGPDGAVVNALPGRWRVSGSTLVIDYDFSPYGGPKRREQRPEQVTIVSLDNGRLVLAGADGQRVTYRRHAAGVPE